MKLSIVTVNLNNAYGLRKTIESTINQTFTDFEYIIIDGGSNDGSIEVIGGKNDKISYWISEPDNGIYQAMNKGILKATGEYLLFLNSGDWLADDNVLSKVFCEPRTADIIYGHTNFVSGDKISLRNATDEEQLSLSYFFTNSLCHPSAFISRKLFDNAVYDEAYKISADKKFFIENIVFRNCSLERIDETISNFNVKGISYKPESRLLLEKENDRIICESFAPRLLKDIEFYRSNYRDIQSLIKIKKFRLLFFFFTGLKKTATLFEKYFRLK